MLSRRTLITIPAAAIAQTPVPLRPSMRLAFNGLGPVRVGMTEAQIRALISSPLHAENEADGCYYLAPRADTSFETQPGFMMRNKKLARIDIYGGEWVTTAGASVGSPEIEIAKLYRGRLQTRPHPYDRSGRYLIVTPTEPVLKGFNLVFETDGRLVTSFRAGLIEATSLVEGCS
jgi:hypothetical protein